MKEISDIPVRRRPQSKDVHPGEPLPEAEPGMRARRQIWEEDAVAASDAAPAAAARPRSAPLILRQAIEDPEPAPETTVPKRRAPEAEMPRPERPLSRPRAAEPVADAMPSRVQPSSMRQRSRPIMPQEQLQPQMPLAAPQSGGVKRAKTRILGFHAQDIPADPMEMAAAEPEPRGSSEAGMFPAGWLVVVDGPGRGNSFSVTTGVSTIGRGDDQCIRLDFGDQSVSRSAHASVAYDDEQKKFYIGHGGKSNVVRRNGAPVLATEEMHHGDLVRIGKTTLRFAAFCGAGFSWDAETTNG